jgi:FtsP/CotA-like multicopper oxidase with cupredoxin domain
VEARPGDHVRIRFRNRLPEPTNLHYHGLHVPPTGNADNSFLEIPSGADFTYEFDLPASHPGGTFWYHPHMREDYAQEMGLYGNIIVEPAEPDYWPPANRELALIVDDLLMQDDEIALFARRARRTPRWDGSATSCSSTARRTFAWRRGAVRWCACT